MCARARTGLASLPPISRNPSLRSHLVYSEREIQQYEANRSSPDRHNRGHGVPSHAGQTRLVAPQSLSSLRIGDPLSKLASLGPVSDSGTYKGMELRKWASTPGMTLCTFGSSGQIVYLESDWDGKNDNPACDLPGLYFGATTLSELRKRFGSNGFEFKDRPPAITTEDGVVMINSWEVGSVVITFLYENRAA